MVRGLRRADGLGHSLSVGDALLEGALGPDQESPRHTVDGEIITQAAEAWFAEMQRTDVRPQTLEGHRLRVRTFVDGMGDLALASVTRAMAADWLAKVAQGRSNRTVNNYAMTMQSLFKSARNRGRFEGE